MLGWLAIPPFLLALALAGMAVSTEPKQDFEERSSSSAQQNDGDDGQEQPSSSSSQSDQDDPNSQPNPDRSGETQDPGGSDQRNSSGRDSDGQRQPITIQTDNGEITIVLDESGRPRSVSAGDSVVADPTRSFTPDPDGGFVGFRVTDQGRLEPVETDDFNSSGDYWIRTEADGLEVIRPDGTQVQLRTNDNGELTGSRSTATGLSEELPNEDGDIVIQPSVDFAPELVVDPNTEPIAITLEDGSITIELQSDGDLTATQNNEPLTADFDDLSAIRVDEDGNFEVVPLDQINPDDTLLVPADSGFDLVRPDGSRVEFRPDGENDGVTATEVSPDGDRRELVPNPDGSVTLDDGRTVGPIDIAEDGGAFERLLDQTSDLPWPWVFGGIALLAALSIGTAVYLHRNRPTGQFDYGQFAVAGVPEDQFEKFLVILKDEPDPTRAIRLAFYAVERGMAGLPTRRSNETPFEWHSRVAETQPEMAAALAPICDLFAMARFAPGEATVANRDLMIEHLRELNWVAQQRSGKPAMATV